MSAVATRAGSEIQVAYALHDHFGDYYQYVWVSMASVMEHTDERVSFHILCDGTLTPRAEREIRQLCGEHGQRVLFHRVPCNPKVPIEDLLRAGYNEGVLYRLYLPDLCPDLPKVVYLDADILATGNVGDLWRTDVSEVEIAGVWDPPRDGCKQVEDAVCPRVMRFWDQVDWSSYVNSGVLVMNLDLIRRRHRLMDECIAFWDEYGMAYPDQDAINHLCRGRIKMLPHRMNAMHAEDGPVSRGYFYHYTHLPADGGAELPLDKEYLSYWARSPFCSGGGAGDGVRFLRRMKNRMDVYLRLDAMGAITLRQALFHAEALIGQGRPAEAYAYLADERWNEPSGWMADRDRDLARDEFQRGRFSAMARSLRQEGRLEDAVALLGDFLEGPATSARRPKGNPWLDRTAEETGLWLLLGEMLSKLGRHAESAKACSHALCLGSVRKNYLAGRALELMAKDAVALGDVEEARRCANMLLCLEPRNLGAKLTLIKAQRMEAEREGGR